MVSHIRASHSHVAGPSYVALKKCEHFTVRFTNMRKSHADEYSAINESRNTPQVHSGNVVIPAHENCFACEWKHSPLHTRVSTASCRPDYFPPFTTGHPLRWQHILLLQCCQLLLVEDREKGNGVAQHHSVMVQDKSPRKME